MWKILATFYIVMSALPSTSNAPSRIHESSDKEYCRECHSEILVKTVHHFPGLEGDCIFCHDIELLADSSFVMRTYGEVTCRGCHTDADHYSSGPHRDINCTSCHLAHTSDYEHLLVDNPIALCSGSCHTSKALGRSHPIGDGVIDVNTRSEMTCISTCHRLHNSDSEDLLFVESPQLCRNCHSDKF